VPFDHAEANRLAQQLEGRLPPDERAQLLGDLDADDELLGVMADAATVQSAAEESLDAAPTTHTLKLRPRRYRKHRRRTPRQWVLPPTVSRPRGETLEGAQILEEHEDPELRHLLWASMRDVVVWAAARDPRAPEKLRYFFAAEAGAHRLALISAARLPVELEVSLIGLAALADHPQTFDPEIASLVCIEISRWARDRGAMGTAVAFAQAAAHCTPEDAGPTVAVGALLRSCAKDPQEIGRAATWLRRGIGLARRRGDWLRYGEALVEMGALHTRLDQREHATRHYEQAVRVAKRTGHRLVRAAALHGLMRLAMDAGDLTAAGTYGSTALRNYGPENPRTHDVLHDMAYLWVLEGQYERAVRILHAQLQRRHGPRERALTLGILARAYAMWGEDHRRDYQSAWSDAWSIINRPGSAGENHAQTLLQLAHAAASLRDWHQLDRAVQTQAREPRHVDRRVSGLLAELASFGRHTPPAQ
jgi:tetratricopeptide (TPR) repeat protein